MFNQLCRIGKDTELRYTPGGTAVANVSLAYDYRDGKENKTQWLNGSLWGKQAESLTQHLTKGKQVFVAMDDLHIREWASNGKSGASLEGRIQKIKFAGGQRDGQAQPQQASNALAPDDIEEDIPF